MGDKTGVVFLLLLVIAVIWLYTSQRLAGVGRALSGKGVLT